MPEEQKSNDDKQVAGLAGTYLKAAIALENFNDGSKLPMLWGPGKSLTDFPSYTPPDKEEWKKKAKQTLFIPQVARFIFTEKSLNFTDDYPPDAVEEAAYYEIVSKGFNVPPYPHDAVIYCRYSGNGIISDFSIIRYTTDWSTYPPRTIDTWGFYYIGMKYRTPIISAGALDYIIDGIAGTGFYARSTGVLVTPF